MCVKWMDKQAVTLIAGNAGDLGRVDLCDQCTLRINLLDQWSELPFYLRIFFDLMDVGMIKSFIIYDKLHPNVIWFLYFKLMLSESVIGSSTTRIREFPNSFPTKQQSTQVVANESQLNLWSINKRAEAVYIAPLLGLKIAHLSLFVIYLCAFRRKETLFCFTTNTQ